MMKCFQETVKTNGSYDLDTFGAKKNLEKDFREKTKSMRKIWIGIEGQMYFLAQFWRFETVSDDDNKRHLIGSALTASWSAKYA